MSFADSIIGRPLATSEERAERIGVAAGIPIFGLDGLTSAAYGPEAAMTLLIPLGIGGVEYGWRIIGAILILLAIVYFSYRQTISAYPGGGGSYTVARENLGARPALFAGAALAIHSILTVAVGISAGVAALVSAFPSLLPHTLALCLAILALLTLVNLRGVRESGVAFMLPTYAFVATLALVIGVGVGKAILTGGSPVAVVRPPDVGRAVDVATWWLLLKAF